MNDSILESVKKLIGGYIYGSAFDSDLIMHINTVFTILYQLGIGPEEGFAIEDDSATWSDYISDVKLLNGVKSYMGSKVRMMFDPPTNSTLADAINRNIAELEWRLNVMVDPGKE